MKMKFTLKNVMGSQLAAIFRNEINKEGTGFDPDFNSSAQLSEDGRVWTTAFSGFSYTLLNPEASAPAVIEYSGGFRGFLSQNLLPAALDGETTHAIVTEGSALERHSVEKFEHADAKTLAQAYGLMQLADKGHFGRDDPFAASVAAIEAAYEISAYMREMGIKDDISCVNAGPGTGYGGSQRNDRDPSVFVTCCPGGRAVNVEFMFSLSSTYIERDRKEVVEQAKAWLERLRPTLELAA